MKYHKNKLFFVAIIACAMSIVASEATIASTIQKPKWVSEREWIEPPLFDLKHSFFAEPSSIARPGDIHHGLLRCRVLVRDDLELDTSLRIFGKGSPELIFNLKVAAHKPVLVRGSGHGYAKWFYARLSELKVNQAISIHVDEEDYFTENEVVGDISIRYPGDRVFGSETAYIELRCMVLNAAMLKQEVAHQMKMFHQFAKESAASLLDNPTKNFRRETTGMQKRILGLAALSGWNSAPVQDASKVYNDIKDIRANIKHAANQKYLSRDRPQAGVPVRLPNTALEVFVKGVECGRKVWNTYEAQVELANKNTFRKTHCIIKIGILNKGSAMQLHAPTSRFGNHYFSVSAINENAETIGLEPLGFVTSTVAADMSGKTTLERNKEVTMLFTPQRHITQGIVVDFERRGQHTLLSANDKVHEK